jgi:PIN domain nuclease of toxin-antitoxin system
MILLDTNALIWLHTRHRRARTLEGRGQLYLSPVSLLELRFLDEAGRLRLRADVELTQIREDPRWNVDNPDSEALFVASLGLTWTRDPFDRLIAAHAIVRGWRLASGDDQLLARLPTRLTFPL